MVQCSFHCAWCMSKGQEGHGKGSKHNCLVQVVCLLQTQKNNSGVSQYSLCYSYQWEHQPPKQYLWYVYFNFDNFGSLPSSRCSAPWSAKSSIPPILPISSRESLSPTVLSLRLLTLSLPRSNTTIYVRLSLRSRGTISWGAQISSLKPTRLDCFCK